MRKWISSLMLALEGAVMLTSALPLLRTGRFFEYSTKVILGYLALPLLPTAGGSDVKKFVFREISAKICCNLACVLL